MTLLYECPRCGGDEIKAQATTTRMVSLNREGEVVDDPLGHVEFDGYYSCDGCGANSDEHGEFAKPRGTPPNA